MRTTLNLDDNLVRAAKGRAAAESRTLTSLVEEGLRAVLRESPVASGRVVLPTSGGDGYAPGVDGDDPAALAARLGEDEESTYRAASRAPA